MFDISNLVKKKCCHVKNLLDIFGKVKLICCDYEVELHYNKTIRLLFNGIKKA